MSSLHYVITIILFILKIIYEFMNFGLLDTAYYSEWLTLLSCSSYTWKYLIYNNLEWKEKSVKLTFFIRSSFEAGHLIQSRNTYLFIILIKNSVYKEKVWYVFCVWASCQMNLTGIY